MYRFFLILICSWAARSEQFFNHIDSSENIVLKAFSEAALNQGQKTWGPVIKGLQVSGFSWVEIGTPRIHYALSIRNAGDQTLVNYLGKATEMTISWNQRGIIKNMLRKKTASFSWKSSELEDLKPGDEAIFYLGFTSCKSMLEFNNYKFFIGDIDMGYHIFTTSLRLNSQGLKCEQDDQEAISQPKIQFDNSDLKKESWIEVDLSKIPDQLIWRLQLPRNYQFSAAKGVLNLQTPTGDNYSEAVIFKFSERLCRGCDPVVGGGDDQCRNQCEVRRVSNSSFRSFEPQKKLVLRPGFYLFELKNFEAVNESDELILDGVVGKSTNIKQAKACENCKSEIPKENLRKLFEIKVQ